MNLHAAGKRHASELYAMVLIAMAIFIACALYSYNPTDSSPTFYSTCSHRPIINWCGICGAYCAALLIHVLGCTAYTVCIILFGVSYVLMRRDVLNIHEYGWDRSLACAVMICVLAGLCNLHAIGDPAIAGGIIGLAAVTNLYQWCDYVGTALLLYVLLVSCILIITQLSFMHVLCSITRTIYRVSARMYAYICALDLFYYFMLLIRRSGYCIMRCSKIIYDLIVRCVSTFLTSPRLKQCELCEVIVTEDDYRSLHLQHDLTHGDEHEIHEIHEIDKIHEIHEVKKYRDTAGHKCDTVIGEDTATHEPNLDIAQDASSSYSDGAQECQQEQRYVLPPTYFFAKGITTIPDALFVQECATRAQLLQEKLAHFGIHGKVTAITRGPVVTLFEYQPHADVKLSKIMALEDDLAMALRALGIRIIAPIPGRSVVGFEIANGTRTDVLLADIIHAQEYEHDAKHLPLILGQDTVGAGVIVDLARMPHLLVAGSTGSGKSVGLNSMLISLLCARTPDELKLILIDPKRLEFTPYEDIAHLLFPIITHTKTAVPVLKWVANQMDERYEKMAACGARHIFDYNKRYEQGMVSERMPFIVIIIDELADLMITVGREVEDAITRITQMARAAGIHLIVATQRPSVDVITGLIKVNFPSRISFRVTSRVDSRTILDCGGADKLLGRGDMLFLDATTSQVQRVHGAYVSDAEIKKVTEHIRAERRVQYLDIVTELQKGQQDIEHKEDLLYEQVLVFIDQVESLSISLLQRKFKIGYNRSARIIDQLEASGRLMPANGSKQRRIIK